MLATCREPTNEPARPEGKRSYRHRRRGEDGGAGSVFAGVGGLGGVIALSSDARMREIGGKTSRLLLPSPSSAFFRGFFLSMRETRSTSCRGAEGVCRVTFGVDGSWESGLAEGAASACAEAASVFSFFVEAFGFASAIGFWAASVLRAADLRVAVLLLVFVAIAVPLKFRSWPERVKPEPYYCTSSCRCTAS